MSTRITRLEAENFKRLRAVEINPDDHTVIISGRNAQGKSSVLDAIQAALAGKKGVKELVEPIRQGESKARVVLELDDLRVERKWTPSGSQLVVGPKDGTAKFNSPQAILDKLIGALSFDPLEFAQADPKTQVEKLIDAVGARDELDKLAEERREVYEQRTVVNRDVKRLSAELEAARRDVPSTYVGGQRMDVAALSLELEAALEVERAREDWQRIEDDIKVLEGRIHEMRKKQQALTDAAIAVVESVKPGPSDDIRRDIATADEHNRVFDASKRAKALGRELDEEQSRSEALSLRIQRIDEARDKLVADLPLPAGLSFNDDGVLLDGIPFVQASAAERLKVSVAMAMAMNPELRVICIRDASLLDGDSFDTIVAMAQEHDFQVWYERVGSDGGIGVVIEDGVVQA